MVLGKQTVAMCLAVALVAGCQTPGPDLSADDTKSSTALQQGTDASAIIATLQAQPSVLPAGSVYDQIAQALFAAENRAAAADLRVAQLKAQAQSKAWLPKIGPSVSLTSLGAVVAGIVVEQVLFSGGQRKADQMAAKADVEVAAVNLSIDANDRLAQALGLYLDAQQAGAVVAQSDAALVRLREIARIAEARVNGGIADSSDFAIVQLKMAQVQARRADAQRAREVALDTLADILLIDTTQLAGSPDIPLPDGPVAPLETLKAQAERDRALASAAQSRAGLMPRLTANGSLVNNSETGLEDALSLDLSTGDGLGFDTGDKMKSFTAEEQAADRLFAQTEKQVQADRKALFHRLSTLTAQLRQSEALRRRALSNQKLFVDQFEIGQRTVMDVASVYETALDEEVTVIRLRHEILKTKLDIARMDGRLVAGATL